MTSRRLGIYILETGSRKPNAARRSCCCCCNVRGRSGLKTTDGIVLSVTGRCGNRIVTMTVRQKRVKKRKVGCWWRVHLKTNLAFRSPRTIHFKKNISVVPANWAARKITNKNKKKKKRKKCQRIVWQSHSDTKNLNLFSQQSINIFTQVYNVRTRRRDITKYFLKFRLVPQNSDFVVRIRTCISKFRPVFYRL